MNRSQVAVACVGLAAVGLVVYLRTARTASDVAVDELVARLCGGSSVEQFQAMEKLLSSGPEVAVPAFRRALKDGSVATRTTVLMGIGRLGRQGAALLPELRAQMANENTRVRQEAIVAIGRVAGPKASAIPEVARALDDADSQVRCNAVRALAESGASAVPLLRRALSRDDMELQIAALETAGKIGPPASPLVPVIADLLDNHPRRLVRWCAGCALGGLGPEGVRALAQRLNVPNTETRLIAATGFVVAGKDARAAEPALLDGLEDPEDDVAAACAAALDRCYEGSLPEAVKTRLLGVLRSAPRVKPIPPDLTWKDGSLVIEDCWKILFGLRNGGWYYAHRYLDAALVVDLDRRAAATLTLARHNRGDHELRSAIRPLLRDRSILVRRAAAIAASLITEANEDAVEMLVGLESDTDHAVRYIARQTLQELDTRDLKRFSRRRN